MNKKAVLLLVCRDEPGIVSRVSNFIFQNGGNILDSDQHCDLETQTFFLRIEWSLENFKLSREAAQRQIEALTQSFRISTQLKYNDSLARLALFVSKYPHCLYDLLVRHQLGELEVEIPLIISNHSELKSVAQHFKIPFHVLSVNAQNKTQAEAAQIKLLQDHQIDFIVLARYMQVLSADFISKYSHRIINIHHSFLPAFVGAKPYHQAYARGVKVIGATSHYVTEEVDQGPIIAQQVAEVSHRDRVEDLVRKGRDLERSALAHAVRMHVQHRVLAYKNKTIVFE
ncbi:MAG: formyltetrahydrofolate deformylase [Deltaproteobacteria bacterium]|nr:formyltetrahydrofolate deformylase [Deltaproteobacteria bacterium]